MQKMVGRSKRLATKEVVEAISEEEEIICLDVPARPNRKGKTGRNSKMKVPEKEKPEKQEDENCFAGIDIEGVSEEEKRQIKEALLASVREQGMSSNSSTTDTPVDESSMNTSNSCGINEVSNENSETDVEENELEDTETKQDHLQVKEEDETQPPSDVEMEEDPVELNLDQSTLESRDDIVEIDSTTSEDVDISLREEEDIRKAEVQDVINSDTVKVDKDKQWKKAVKAVRPELAEENSGEKGLTGKHSHTITGSELMEDASAQLNETDDSEGFEPGLQSDLERGQESSDGQSSPGPSLSRPCQHQSVSREGQAGLYQGQDVKGQAGLCQGADVAASKGQADLCQEAGVSEKIVQSDSVETFTSKKSDSLESSTSQKSMSQKSMESVNDSSKSSGSLKRVGQTNSSPDDKIGFVHIPLKRHYRGVKKEFQNIQHDKYFGDTAEIERSAKAIYQLFETFRRKLYEAQRKCREKVPWPEPVKSGQHQSRTIDVKKRGIDSICLDLSDEEKEEKKAENDRTRCKNVAGESGSDSGLPEINREARRTHRSKPVDKFFMSADTLPCDIDFKSADTYDIDNDDEDFVPCLRNRLRRSPKACTKSNPYENTKPLRRSGRKLGVNSDKLENKILAEETQQENQDLQEAIRRSKVESQRSLPETQLEDDDFDWLSVKQQNGNEEFENQIHKAKLIGYTIPKSGQMYSKSHQKVVSTERTNGAEQSVLIEENDFETKTAKQIDIQQKQVPQEHNALKSRGRNRKMKEVGVTLVEDTQDKDSDQEDSRKLTGKRKRNCFKIDSESDEESIAESQDVNGPLETLSRDKKLNSDMSGDRNRENTKNSKSEGFFTSVINRMKNFVTPTKSEGGNNEGSQSPVISKKRIKLSPKPCDKNDTEYETEAFNEFKSASAEKKEKDARTETKKKNIQLKSASAEKKGKDARTETKKKNIQLTFCENDEKDGDEDQVERPEKNERGEQSGISAGVKRLVSRPSSRDSDVSDSVSVTSSQMSNNILDEKGDIYSTQYCEIRRRKGKDGQWKSSQKLETNKKEFQEVLLLDSDDEDIVLNEPKKTFDVKRFDKKPTVVKGVKLVEKSESQKMPRKEVISKYFDKIPQEEDKDIPINLDPEPESTKAGSNIKSGIVSEQMNRVGTSTRLRAVSRNKETSVKGSLSEKEHDVAKEEIHINLSSLEEKERNFSKSYQKNTTRLALRQLGNMDTIHNLDIESENPPVMLNDANKLSHNTNTLEQYFGGARPKTRHSELNSRLHEQKPVNKRQRKVSETITSGAYEAGESGTQTKGGMEVDQDVVGEDWSQVKGSLRKRHVEHDDDEETDVPSVLKKKVEMVECPICNNKYPSSIIEQHAALCDGAPEDEEPSGNMTGDEYIQHLAEQHPHLTREAILELVHQQLHHQDHHHHHHHHHPDPDHVGGLHEHIGHLHETDGEDEEVGNIIEKDVHVEDVAKDIRCSPGEEGELQACYICDAQIPKGKSYEIHLNRCLKLAAQQQAEVDRKGYNTVFADSEEEEIQVRNLRGRQINPGERSNTPRAARRQVEDSPSHHRSMKPRPNPESPASRQVGIEQIKVVVIESQQYDQGDGGNEQGAAKRLIMRGNRNKAAWNDDGYRPVQTTVLDSEEENTSESSWEDSSSTDSSDDDNITLASVVRSGSSALVTGPWNKNTYHSKNVNQSEGCNDVPDWVRTGVHSPIKTFVPISQQDDSDYFQQQFSYQRDRVEKRMNKRKRSKIGGQKRRRKRRKVRKTKGKT